MIDYEIREYTGDDMPAMFALWQAVFGDPDAFISAFLRLLPRIGTAVVAVAGGEIVGAAYVITALELCQGPVRQTCGYVYGVAVREELRRCGIGAALVRSVCTLGRQRGAAVCGAQPAGAELIQWYRNVSPLRDPLCRRTLETPCRPARTVTRLSPAEYLLRRQALCPDQLCLRPSAAVTELLDAACTVFGGGIFACADGIAAAFREGDTAVFYEVLPWSEARQSVAAAVGCAMGCAQSRYFVPDPRGTPFLLFDAPLPQSLDFPFTFA